MKRLWRWSGLVLTALAVIQLAACSGRPAPAVPTATDAPTASAVPAATAISEASPTPPSTLPAPTVTASAVQLQVIEFYSPM